MVVPSDPDLVRAPHSLMSFQRSSHTVNTSRTVARMRLRKSGITLSDTPVRVLVPAEEYATVVTLGLSPTYINFPDVHGKHDGQCRGGSGDDTSRRLFVPC